MLYLIAVPVGIITGLFVHPRYLAPVAAVTATIAVQLLLWGLGY